MDDVAVNGGQRSLTWRADVASQEGARRVGRVTAGRNFDRRVAARPASDGGDFCATEIFFERAFQW
jgi:hypothetical protein